MGYELRNNLGMDRTFITHDWPHDWRPTKAAALRRVDESFANIRRG